MNGNHSENINPALKENEDFSVMELFATFRNWVSYLLSKWLFMLFFIIAGIIVGFAYAHYKKPTYTASVTFVLEEGGSGAGSLGQYAGLASMVGIDIGGGGNGLFSGDNIMALYKSRRMLQQVLLGVAEFDGKKQQLIERYIAFNKLRKKWDSPTLQQISFADTSKFTLLQDSILGEVVKDINLNYLTVLKPDKKSSILQVDVKSKDQVFAKIFTERVVAKVNEFYVQSKTKKSAENLAILQHQTDSVKAVMNGAIFSAASAMDATPNLNPARQVLRAPVQRSQFNAEANKLILSELVKNLELSKISIRKETPLIQIIDRPTLPLESNKLSKIKSTIIAAFLFAFLGGALLILRKNIVS